jgi:hypothetical protein
MTVLCYDRYCDEIVTQTGLLTSAITGADLTGQVPTCPDWNVGQLLRPYGEGGTFQDVMTGSACSVPRALTVPVSSRNSRPSAGGSRR